MPEIPAGTTDDTLQPGKGQSTGQKETEESLVKHYPLVARGMAGPPMIIEPDWFLDHVPHAITIGAKILILEKQDSQTSSR